MKNILPLLIVLCLVGLGILALVAHGGETATVNPDESSGYNYVVVDGMPCIEQTYSIGANYNKSITCDWSQWNGYMEDGVIVFPENR